jgi:hypothetical protein
MDGLTPSQHIRHPVTDAKQRPGFPTSNIKNQRLCRFLIETRSLPAFARSYPRRFTFYLAHAIRSILPSAFLQVVLFQPGDLHKCAQQSLFQRLISTDRNGANGMSDMAGKAAR